MFAERTAIALGVLIFSGYIYIQTYLQYFGVSIFDAQITPASFIYYSFRPAFGLLFDLDEGVGVLAVLAICAGTLTYLIAQRLPEHVAIRGPLLTIAAFIFAYFLAHETAFIDARNLARGGGLSVEFVFTTPPSVLTEANVPLCAPPRPPSGSELAAQNGAGSSEAPTRFLTAQETIPSALAIASECQKLRMVWRTKDHVVVTRTYAEAFCPCRYARGETPAYCLGPGNAEALLVPETFYVPIGAVEYQRTRRVKVWTSIFDREPKQRRVLPC